MRTPQAPRRSRPQPAIALLATLILLIATVYGLTAISYPISLIRQEVPISTRWIMQAVSSEFLLGDAAAMRQIVINYTRGFAGIGAHTLFGGLALTLCALQFVAPLRRFSPRLHRVLGWSAAASIGLAMTGAMGYLWVTPAKDGPSGEPFAAALWVQSLTTLMALGLAIRSARQRDFRTHMAWMTLLMASLMNAPMLRLEGVLVGRLLPLNGFQANAGLAVILMPQAVWLMAWWMNRIGQLDLPLLRPRLTLSMPAMQTMAAMGTVVVVHEGILAPWGMDALAHWRTADTLLPAMAALWALSTAALLWHLPGEGHHVQSGRPVRIRVLALMATSAVGAWLLVTTPQAHSPVNLIGRQFYWAAYGVSTLSLALFGLLQRQTSLALVPWRTMLLINALQPGLCLPFGIALAWTGWSLSAIQTSALTLSWAFVAWHGFASAYGLPLPGGGVRNMPTGKSCAQV
ncbi:MAG TPA: DUF2306 domain-containing protein [Aquabacterium sp.]|uniref:DUF2306 domain-containing protein n=1 Tax=Aquabacterium sp. TaxID=1872578 RepID=UPI002E3523D6|nr:DUF2306 domain-containing protein [Aquabacterium sp.]HEX5356121.1 DUF2306 domain-containing protein [Aquabacterium sp.]